MKILRVLRETKSIIKTIWAWIDWVEIYKQVIAEIRHAKPIFIIIFILVLMIMLGMAEDVSQRVNRLERQMNRYNPVTIDMAGIK